LLIKFKVNISSINQSWTVGIRFVGDTCPWSSRQVVALHANFADLFFLVEAETIWIWNLANSVFIHVATLNASQALMSIELWTKRIALLLSIVLNGSFSFENTSSFRSQLIISETSQAVAFSVAGSAQVIGLLANSWKVQEISMITSFASWSLIVELNTLSLYSLTSSLNNVVRISAFYTDIFSLFQTIFDGLFSRDLSGESINCISNIVQSKELILELSVSFLNSEHEIVLILFFRIYSE